jgi:single-strand DNA-binding protein
MASFNKAIVMGNLTRDVELRHIPSGTAVADIGVAVNDRKKVGDEWVDETTFVDVTLWGRTAEVAAEYLSKGSPVFVEGKLKQDSWEDKESGQKRSKIKIVADRMQLVGGKSDAPTAGQSRQQPAPQQSSTEDLAPF